MDTNNNTRNIVIVDIDNTVHESDITMKRASMELFNSPFKWCQQPEWYVFGDEQMPLEHGLKVFNRMHDRDMIFLTDPYVGSIEGLHAIADAGYEIKYFTDRKPEAQADTVDWLEKYGMPNAEAVTCCKDKRAELAEIKDQIVTIIDDRPRTLIYSKFELGIPKVYSLKHPYNRNLTDIPDIFLRDTWKELTETFMLEMGVASVRAGSTLQS